MRSSIIEIKDPADRFDLSYVFANDMPSLGKKDSALEEMAGGAREIALGGYCRAALVHPGEARELSARLSGSKGRPEVVIDFPDGAGGIVTKESQARASHEAGAVSGDVVINLHAVKSRNKKILLDEFKAAKSFLPDIKVIAQIPYLWQYDKESIPWLLE